MRWVGRQLPPISAVLSERLHSHSRCESISSFLLFEALETSPFHHALLNRPIVGKTSVQDLLIGCSCKRRSKILGHHLRSLVPRNRDNPLRPVAEQSRMVVGSPRTKQDLSGGHFFLLESLYGNDDFPCLHLLAEHWSPKWKAALILSGSEEQGQSGVIVAEGMVVPLFERKCFHSVGPDSEPMKRYRD